MPSKAGRRRSEVGPAVIATPVSAPPPTFDPTLLARPLRRGYETERFNELFRRQAELSPTESDELYAYRLRRLTARERRLQRATGGTEEQLRNAVGDYQRRLAEVRHLEELRRQTGLPAGYEGDLGVEGGARGRPAELAMLRPRGLVAGEGPGGTDGRTARSACPISSLHRQSRTRRSTWWRRIRIRLRR
jgi:hypothetical protein